MSRVRLNCHLTLADRPVIAAIAWFHDRPARTIRLATFTVADRLPWRLFSAFVDCCRNRGSEAGQRTACIDCPAGHAFAIRAIVVARTPTGPSTASLIVHLAQLRDAFGVKWRKAPAARRSVVFSDSWSASVRLCSPGRHLERCCRNPEAARGDRWQNLATRFDNFLDRPPRICQHLRLRARLKCGASDCDEKSTGFGRADPARLSALSDAVVTVDAMHCQKKHSSMPWPVVCT